jgi:transposase
MSKSAAGRLFGIDRKTVAKILLHSVPPGYRRTALPVRPKLDPFIPIIDQILEDDKRVIKKQRHTAKRIHARLRDEHGFTGGITIVTDYVREKQRRSKEVFVPLSHAPGHAQVDFGETLGVIDGVECKLHYFAMVDIGSAIGLSDNVDAAFGRVLLQSISCRDHRSVLRRACLSFCVLRRGAVVDPV